MRPVVVNIPLLHPWRNDETDNPIEPAEVYSIETVMLNLDDTEAVLGKELTQRLKMIDQVAAERAGAHSEYMGPSHESHYRALRHQISMVTRFVGQGNLDHALDLLDGIPRAVAGVVSDQRDRTLLRARGFLEPPGAPTTRERLIKVRTERASGVPVADSVPEAGPIFSPGETRAALCVDGIPRLPAQYHYDLSVQLVESADRELGSGVAAVDVFPLGAGHTAPFTMRAADLHDPQLRVRLQTMLDQSTKGRETVNLDRAAAEVNDYYNSGVSGPVSPDAVRTVFLPDVFDPANASARMMSFSGRFEELWAQSGGERIAPTPQDRRRYPDTPWTPDQSRGRQPDRRPKGP